MTKYDPKRIGDKSVVAILNRLVQLDKDVALPFGDNCRYDILVDEKRDGTFNRIQCKTGRLKNGIISFSCRSVNWNTGISKNYRGQADTFGIFCPENGKVYLVPVADTGISECSLRIKEPNKKLTNIRMAAMYEI